MDKEDVAKFVVIRFQISTFATLETVWNENVCTLSAL